MNVSNVGTGADRQIMFCQWAVAESFSQDEIKTRCLLPIEEISPNESVYNYVKANFGFEYVNGRKGAGIICCLNGKKIEESAKFSSLVLGQSLEERTCVVCIYDESYPNFVKKFFDLLSSFDLNKFLVEKFIGEILTCHKIASRFTQDVFGKSLRQIVEEEQGKQTGEFSHGLGNDASDALGLFPFDVAEPDQFKLDEDLSRLSMEDRPLFCLDDISITRELPSFP
ncbi:MAG: hypothetical protein LBS87_01865 [Puniceicoccales bacterium]|jgi:hypothetical protein|nr:hypothetical protein [Puniceicoccales bacterium]